MDNFYLLGFWINAYCPSQKEYFWAGPFDSRKDALAFGKRKQERGQPKEFYDWIKGTNRCFSSKELFVKAANKIGMNPRVY